MHKKPLYELRDAWFNKTQYKAFLEDKNFGGITGKFENGTWEIVRNSNRMFDGSLYLPLIDHTDTIINCLPWTAAAAAHQWWYASTGIPDPYSGLNKRTRMRTFKDSKWLGKVCLIDVVQEVDCIRVLKEYEALEVAQAKRVWRIWLNASGNYDGICQVGTNKKFYPSFKKADYQSTVMFLRAWLDKGNAGQ